MRAAFGKRYSIQVADLPIARHGARAFGTPPGPQSLAASGLPIQILQDQAEDTDAIFNPATETYTIPAAMAGIWINGFNSSVAVGGAAPSLGRQTCRTTYGGSFLMPDASPDVLNFETVLMFMQLPVAATVDQACTNANGGGVPGSIGAGSAGGAVSTSYLYKLDT